MLQYNSKLFACTRKLCIGIGELDGVLKAVYILPLRTIVLTQSIFRAFKNYQSGERAINTVQRSVSCYKVRIRLFEI